MSTAEDISAADIISSAHARFTAKHVWTFGKVSDLFKAAGWTVDTDWDLAQWHGHPCPRSHTITYRQDWGVAAVIDLEYDLDEQGLESKVEKVTFYFDEEKKIADTFTQQATQLMIEGVKSWS